MPPSRGRDPSCRRLRGGRRLALVLLLLGVGPTARAGPREDVIVAAMRLAEADNYSWITTVTDDARTYEIRGGTSREGYSRVRMPAVNALRRRLGRGVTDTDIEFIFRGPQAWVVLSDRGWLKPEELPVPPAETKSPASTSPAGASVTTGASGSGGLLPRDLPVEVTITNPETGDERKRRYSNLQLGLSLPQDELSLIVSSHATLSAEGDAASGTLTELGARLLLVRDGQNDITPLRATGTFQLWLQGGRVVRYRIRLEGTLLVDTPRGRREIAVTQASETIVKDVGSTRFEVPADARLPLGP